MHRLANYRDPHFDPQEGQPVTRILLGQVEVESDHYEELQAHCGEVYHRAPEQVFLGGLQVVSQIR